MIIISQLFGALISSLINKTKNLVYLMNEVLIFIFEHGYCVYKELLL